MKLFDYDLEAVETLKSPSNKKNFSNDTIEGFKLDSNSSIQSSQINETSKKIELTNYI